MDYVVMANYLLKSIEGIKEYQYNVEYCNKDWTDCDCEDITDEMIEKAKQDSSDCHWSFERASSRLLVLMQYVNLLTCQKISKIKTLNTKL